MGYSPWACKRVRPTKQQQLYQAGRTPGTVRDVGEIAPSVPVSPQTKIGQVIRKGPLQSDNHIQQYQWQLKRYCYRYLLFILITHTLYSKRAQSSCFPFPLQDTVSSLPDPAFFLSRLIFGERVLSTHLSYLSYWAMAKGY